MAARWTTGMRFSWAVLDAVREAVGPDFIVGIRMVADEHFETSAFEGGGHRNRQTAPATSGKFDFLNIIRGHIDHGRGTCRCHPDHRHALSAASGFRRRCTRGDEIPGVPCSPHRRCRHSQACDRRGQARHGRHDARPYRRSAYCQEDHGGPRKPDHAPASARPTVSTASTKAARRSVSTMRPPAAKRPIPHVIRKRRTG